MKTKLTLIIIAVLLSSSISSNAQAYQSIKIADVEYNTHSSFQGINVNLIQPQTDGSFLIELYNTNYNDPYDGVSYKTSYSFEWYLSYNGKRVSDYYRSTIRCRKEELKKVYVWPAKVPKGHEKYVTVQFGREPIKKDRRDDY
ncbi:MAG: hypothetical protein IKU59_07125 [Bacteroidales bacterium]|nr:hypothetical protein [Bacteroidales bacterium]